MKTKRRLSGPDLVGGFEAMTLAPGSRLAEYRQARTLTAIRASMDPRVAWLDALSRAAEARSTAEAARHR